MRFQIFLYLLQSTLILKVHLGRSYTGTWTQVFTLVRQVLCHLRHTSSLFNSGYFCPGLSILHLSISVFCLTWDDKGAPPHPAFSVEMGCSNLFFFFGHGWPWNIILIISAWEVARIIGVNHWLDKKIHFWVRLNWLWNQPSPFLNLSSFFKSWNNFILQEKINK
jgi:hypothetical protein